MTGSTRLSTRDRRALLLGAVILAPSMLFSLSVRPYQQAIRDARAQLEIERDLLTRERRLLAGAVDLPDRQERAAVLLALEAPRLFAAPDPVSATASLSGYVAEHSRGHRVLLQQTETGAPQPANGAAGVTGLTVTLRAIGDLEGILGFLHELEEGPKLLRVERLTIEQAQRFGTPGAEDEEVLSLSALVRGYAVQ